MAKSVYNRIKCYFLKHKFVRYPMIDGDIYIVCSKCEHTIIKKRETIIEEDYLNE